MNKESIFRFLMLDAKAKTKRLILFGVFSISNSLNAAQIYVNGSPYGNVSSYSDNGMTVLSRTDGYTVGVSSSSFQTGNETGQYAISARQTISSYVSFKQGDGNIEIPDSPGGGLPNTNGGSTNSNPSSSTFTGSLAYYIDGFLKANTTIYNSPRNMIYGPAGASVSAVISLVDIIDQNRKVTQEQIDAQISDGAFGHRVTLKGPIGDTGGWIDYDSDELVLNSLLYTSPIEFNLNHTYLFTFSLSTGVDGRAGHVWGDSNPITQSFEAEANFYNTFGLQVNIPIISGIPDGYTVTSPDFNIQNNCIGGCNIPSVPLPPSFSLMGIGIAGLRLFCLRKAST